MFLKPKKKCMLCSAKVMNSIERTVPVYGYTTPQKRHFCSNNHADIFENKIKEIMKHHKPASRSCYRC